MTLLNAGIIVPAGKLEETVAAMEAIGHRDCWGIQVVFWPMSRQFWLRTSLSREGERMLRHLCPWAEISWLEPQEYYQETPEM